MVVGDGATPVTFVLHFSLQKFSQIDVHKAVMPFLRNLSSRPS